MKLKRDFYEREALLVARELLGKYLVRVKETLTTAGKIVEVEAYVGPGDAAAHTYKGLRTNRTEVAFGSGGFSYVYMIYGIHHCFNIVANTEGKPELILIRALEPVDGLDIMKNRRKIENVKSLCSGPGKLCLAMDITKDDNAVDLYGDCLYLLDNNIVPQNDIISTPRINIDYAGEARDYPWRFLIKGNKFVSK